MRARIPATAAYSALLVAKYWLPALAVLPLSVMFMPSLAILLFPAASVVKETVVLGQFTAMKVLGAGFGVGLLARELVKPSLRIRFDSVSAVFMAWGILVLVSASHVLLYMEPRTGLLASVGASSAIMEMLGRFMLVVFALVLYHYTSSFSRQQVQRRLWSMVQVTTLALLATNLMVLFGLHELTATAGVERFFLESSDPNDYACLTAILLACPLAISSSSASKLWKALAAACLVAGLATLAGAASRTAFLILASIVAVYVLSLGRTHRAQRRLLLLLAFAGGAGLFLVGPDRILARFLGTSLKELSLGYRLEYWAHGIEAFLSRPLLGYGGTVASDIWLNISAFGRPQVMHSTYIGLLVEYGIAGLLVMTVTASALLTRTRRMWVRLQLAERLPFVMLLGVLVGGMWLQWLFKELGWFLLPLCFGVLHAAESDKGLSIRGQPSSTRCGASHA